MRSRGAQHLLKKRCCKEARFAADINHQVSKCVVAEAARSGRGVAVEQLGGIRSRARFRKPQRAALHSWAFAQLGGFLGYKGSGRWGGVHGSRPGLHVADVSRVRLGGQA